MRITESTIRRIIREEARRVLGTGSLRINESDFDDEDAEDDWDDEEDFDEEADIPGMHGETDEHYIATEIVDELGEDAAQSLYDECVYNSDASAEDKLEDYIGDFGGGTFDGSNVDVLEAIRKVLLKLRLSRSSRSESREEARRALRETRRGVDPEPAFDKLDKAGRAEHDRYLADVEDNEPGDIETIAQQIIDEVGPSRAKLFYNEIAAGSWPPDPKMARELAGLINDFSGVPGLGDDHLNQMAVLRAVSNIIRGPAHRRRYE